jgi:hypothetical protein
MKQPFEAYSERHQRAIDREAVLEACRFFSVKDAVRWVIGAYRDAVTLIQPPQTEPWIDPVDGVHWSGPGVFADLFKDAFGARVELASCRAKLYKLASPLPKCVSMYHPNYPREWWDLENAPAVSFEELEAGDVRSLLLRRKESTLPLCGTVSEPAGSVGVPDAT